ncbi:M3 family oligoendopeptidase [Paracholeplasma manati]|uniref:M3 family oligoendopeptidase n=1 Tax=Paracholeplasma manati TaxID=591373 RepID=A0ABT2Y4H4_9MOLU|nr:M3 family oligoendopeptidase [Paracholeplasma manati]MCV2231634.1 M3 family oligoendopeptidase [Paracholeplasma manati]MDG0888623.1 M3 family oligoendopeptidase [Paracholeplasma manati]
MKFQDYVYQRPDVDAIKQKYVAFTEAFKAAKDANEQTEIIKQVFGLIDEVDTMYQLVSIRYSLNTQDDFYEAEMNFMDEVSPELQNYVNEFNKLVYASPFKPELVNVFGQHYFNQLEVSLQSFDEKIIPLLQEENKLNSKYSKVVASAQIEFDGGVYNLSQMSPFTQSKDRETRHRAQLKISEFFESKEAELDDIYDQLVSVRNQAAQALGYANFVELGYKRLGRTDYGSKEVKAYREQIKRDVVPFVEKLVARKAKRLGIQDLKSYDTISFLSGNPTPKGDLDWQVAQATTMYKALSKETDEFFTFMKDSGLLELDSKKGKAGGGYCTFIPGYKAPFIFANFNGTSHDVDVLTHEAGHAFQVYQSREFINPMQRFPGYEACEIHSMSMEFFAWPWVPLFFKEDAQKYYFSHLSGAISFLPYGALVDEFQHEIYENPSMSKDERKATWRRLEKQYIPSRDYDDDKFMEKGTYWFRQGHIFQSPFYYIDYTLAQVCAFQYWIRDHKDHQEAWSSYVDLCKLGGSKGFVALMKDAKLDSPFEDGTILRTIQPLEAFLNTIDDTKL